MVGAADGGPAFPGLERFRRFDDRTGQYVEDFAPTGGMTLRDYFAGQCIGQFICGAMLAAATHPEMNSPEVIAKAAYEIADAMLTVRRAK